MMWFLAEMAGATGQNRYRAGAERIGGAEGYLVVLRVVQEQQTATVQAGFVARPGANSIYQVLGYTTPERALPMYEKIVKGQNVLEPGIPESFRVMTKELQSLGLDVGLLENTDTPQITE